MVDMHVWYCHGKNGPTQIWSWGPNLAAIFGLGPNLAAIFGPTGQYIAARFGLGFRDGAGPNKTQYLVRPDHSRHPDRIFRDSTQAFQFGSGGEEECPVHTAVRICV